MAILSAVSSSARQLFLLLRCISFAPKAQVSISPEGIRFSVEESRAMQGLAFLEKSLFTTYNYSTPVINSQDSIDSDTALPPPFEISLTALLETLQILGSTDPTANTRSSSLGPYNISFTARASAANTAFDNRVLGLSGLCRISYAAIGEPLCITLEEGNVTTTCELVTYELNEEEAEGDIPFQRDALVQKVIMRSALLYEGINELSSLSPERLTITCSPTAPFFALSALGPLGSATVEFPRYAKETHNIQSMRTDGSKEPHSLETFQVQSKTVNSYKFSFIKGAARAMAAASKVSIRGDDQGVLSLQFMIELDASAATGGTVSFVDFRFVPFVADEDGEDEDYEDEDKEAEDSGVNSGKADTGWD